MKRIIIAAHAGYSKGLESAMKFIVGDDGQVDRIEAFTVDEDPAARFEEMIASFEKNDKVVVLTDLTAGSVNKLIAGKLSQYNFYLISGVNLAILLGIASASEEEINEEFIQYVVEEGKQDITFVNRSLENSAPDESKDDFF